MVDFYTTVLPGLVSGLISVALAFIGIRAARAKIKDETTAAIELAENKERTALRNELRKELDRLRKVIDEQSARIGDQNDRILKLELALERARLQRDELRRLLIREGITYDQGSNSGSGGL